MLYSIQYVMDIQNITRSYAARLLGYRDANKAARELFDIVEAVIHDDKEYSKTKAFVLQIIQVMHTIDPEYNNEVAAAYYNLVTSYASLPRQLSWIEQQPSKLWAVGSNPTRGAI